MADWGLSELARLTDRIADAGLKATAALLKKVFENDKGSDLFLIQFETLTVTTGRSSR